LKTWGLLQLEVIFISTIFSISVWSPKLKLKIWGRSVQWLLRYSTFNVWGLLPLEVVFITTIFLFQFSPLSLSFKYEEDLLSGCWDILILIFRGLLLLEVVFISIYFLYFTLVKGTKLKYKKMVEMKMTSNVEIFRKISSLVAEIFYLKYFEVFFHWRSSSFQTFFLSQFGPLSLSFNCMSSSFELW
jgi:hypothetical protein